MITLASISLFIASSICYLTIRAMNALTAPVFDMEQFKRDYHDKFAPAIKNMSVSFEEAAAAIGKLGKAASAHFS